LVKTTKIALGGGILLKIKKHLHLYAHPKYKRKQAKKCFRTIVVRHFSLVYKNSAFKRMARMSLLGRPFSKHGDGISDFLDALAARAAVPLIYMLSPTSHPLF